VPHGSSYKEEAMGEILDKLKDKAKHAEEAIKEGARKVGGMAEEEKEKLKGKLEDMKHGIHPPK
jgi:hypothetical protein